MAFAIIIRGPAGTGKSTISEELKHELPNTIHLDIDKFKHVISKDSSEVRSKIAHNVGSYFIEQLIENNFNLIIEEIFFEAYYLEVINLLNKHEYDTLKIFLTASKNTLINRDKTRNKNKGEKIISQLKTLIQPLDEDIIIDSSKLSLLEVKTKIIDKLKLDKLI